MKTLLIVLAFNALITDFTNCEIFTSTDELVKLIDSQRILIEGIEKFVEELDNEIETLKSKLTEFESEHSIMSSDPQSYVENPLNAFVLIKTLTHDIEKIKNGFRTKFKPFEKVLKSIELQPEDLDGAVNGLLTVQEVYKLKSKDLAQGIVYGKKSRKFLTADELFTLGDQLLNHNRVKAANYLRFALKRADEKTKVEYLDKILSTFRDNPEFESYIPKIDESDNKMELTVEFLSKMYPPTKMRTAYEKLRDEYAEAEKKLFSKSCRGLNVKNASESARLYCTLRSTNYFTKIAPIKVEIINLEPTVAIYHEIVSESEISAIKDFTKSSLESASFQNYFKVLKRKIVEDSESEIFEKLTKRVEDISGLNAKGFEPTVVQNYGIGGVYKMHFDHFLSWNENFTTNVADGNRIASVIFYLSDVEKGGFTIFPFLKLHVVPKKGSAVFWFNLSTSGDRESLIMHAGCPVAIGSKWVANKMIREHGQEFNRPCELIQKPTIENYWELLKV